MRHARELMRPALTVAPATTIADLARLLLAEGSDGACVVEDGALVGIVTAMDCIFRGKRVHVPPVFVLLDIVIPLERPERTREELRKLGAATVGGLMTRKVVTVTPDSPVDVLATKMVEQHLTVLPVVDQGALVGMVTKPDLLRLVVDATSTG